MDWTEITAYLQTVVGTHPKFPTLPCQQQLFSRFNQTPKLITYDDLIRENFENKSKSKRFRLLFDDEIQGHCGSDVLAYYLSFHGNKKWGIYIIDAGVDYLASEIMKLAPRHKIPLSRLDAEYLAKHNLLLHELGHHAAEIVHTSLAWDYNRPNSYEIHIDNELQQSRHLPPKDQTLHNHEEAVCNWNVTKNKLNFEIRARNHINTISDFMLTQPLGYKDFGKITGRNYLENIMDVRTAIGLPKETKINLKKQFRAHSKLDKVKPLTKKKKENWTQVPIYLIRTGKQMKK